VGVFSVVRVLLELKVGVLYIGDDNDGDDGRQKDEF